VRAIFSILTRWRRLVGLLFVSTVFVPGAVVRSDGRSAPRLFDVTAAHTVVDGRPIEPTDHFTPDDTPIYVWYRCDGCTIGMVLTASWWYLEPDPPLRLARESVTLNTLEDFGEFHRELLSGQRWPLGSYCVELRINGAAAAEVSFRVVVNTQR